MPLFRRQIDRRRIARLDPEGLGQKRRLAQMAAGLAHQHRHVALGGPSGDDLVDRGQKPHGADGRRRQDARAVGFVVKADVARDDRHVQRRAGLADPFQRADELAHDLGLFGVAEVQVVGGGKGQGADGGQVAVGLGHRLPAALDRVGLDVARRHVRGEGQRLGGAMDAHHAGVVRGGHGGVAGSKGGGIVVGVVDATTGGEPLDGGVEADLGDADLTAGGQGAERS